jgi:hypothetical protein
MSKTIKFSPILDQSALLWGFFPVKEMKYYTVYLIGLYLIYSLLEAQEISSPWYAYFCVFGVLVLAQWVLLGDREWVFFGKFLKGRKLGMAQLTFEPTDTELKPELKPKRVGITLETPVEKVSHLQSYVEFRFKGQQIGAVLLKDSKGWEVKFAFKHYGIPNSTDSGSAFDLAKMVESGLDCLKPDELLSIETATVSDPSERIAYLQSLIDKGTLPFNLQLLIRSEQDRTKILADSHRWNIMRSTIYYPYTVGEDTRKATDFVEKILFKIKNLYYSVNKSKKPKIKTLLNQLLNNAYKEGLPCADDLLTSRMGLNVEALNAQEMWEIDWSRVNKGKAPKIPCCIIVDENGVKLGGRGNLHPDSLLHKAAPVEHKTYVQLPGKTLSIPGKTPNDPPVIKKTYAGIATLNQKPRKTFQAEDPKDRLRQLQFASSAFYDPSVFNTRVVVQFSGKPQKRVLENADKLAEQANRSRKNAEFQGKLSPDAKFKQQAAEDSGWVLREGGKVVQFSWAAVIERESEEELNLAISKFCALPAFSGEIVEREVEYAHLVWWQTLSTQKEPLLSEPWERRRSDVTSALVGLVPLMMDSSKDRVGVAYLTQENFTPIYQDPFCPAPHRHSFKVAGTGSGKTVDHIGHIIHALAEDGNVVIVDATRGDGTGAFDPIVDFLDGSRYSTKTDSYNIFEGRDFRNFKDDESRNEAIATFRDFLVKALKDLSMGGDEDARTLKTNADILSILVEAFLNQEDIKHRRDAAYDGGMGSLQWSRFPTFRDFLKFLKIENLPAINQTKEYADAIGSMNLSFSAVLSRPLGAAIANPSTFKANSNLILVGIGSVDAQDIKPVALAAAAFVFASTADAEKTLFIGDENTYLAPIDAYMSMVSSFYLKGRTMGVHANLIGQSLAATNQSPFAQNIYDNCSTFMAGRVSKDGKKDLVERGVPEHLFERRLSDRDSGQRADRENAVSRWIYSEPEEGRHYKVFSVPSYDHLALAVNGRGDIKDREVYAAQYPDDKCAANRAFANHIRSRSNDAELFAGSISRSDDGTDEIDL